MEKKSKKLNKKWIIIIGVAVVAIAAFVVIGLPKILAGSSSASAASYTTKAVEKGTISTTVGATGNVRTNQSVTLAWQTSGIIEKVNVTKGQTVTAGTVLANLTQSSLPQTVIDAQTSLATAQKNLDDLLNSGTARANAELALITSEQTLQTAQKTAQSKLYQRASQSQVDTAQANLTLAQNALDQATDVFNRNKNRSQSDNEYAAALSQFAAAQQKYDSAQMNYQYTQALPDALSVQSASASVDVAQAAYLDAKRAWERVKDGPNADDVAAAEAAVASAQATLDQAQITAPISGTITAVYTKPGDLVSAQTTAFQIDDMTHLYTDIDVSEVDINQIKIGQAAEVTFDAIANKTFQGSVSDIDTVGVSTSGVVNYTVTVEISTQDSQIKPGMTTSANITVSEIKDALLVPTTAIKTVGTQKVVYVMQNSALSPVVITVGSASGTNTQVTGSNLKEGDLVVTNPPTATSLTTTSSRGLLGGLLGGALGGGGGGPVDGGGPNGAGGPPSNSSSSSSKSNSSSSGNSSSGSSNSGNSSSSGGTQ